MKYNHIIITVLALAIFATPLSHVSADAWWGKGYRSPEWVLQNGGSIIRYKLKGNNKDEYKAMMFRDGKYVEVEFGSSATFDDAKDGRYEIKFYHCDGSCSSHKTDNKKKIRKSDSRKDRIYVTARPGETTFIEFDTKKKKAKIVAVQKFGGTRVAGDGSKPVVVKPTYTPQQLIAFAAEREEGNVCAKDQIHPIVKTFFVFPGDKTTNKKTDNS